MMLQAEAKRRAVSPADAGRPVNGNASDADAGSGGDDGSEEEDDEEGLGLAAQHKERALQALATKPAAIKPSTQVPPELRLR